MKKCFLILIVIFPFLCWSQNMKVTSKKGSINDEYALSGVSKITFSDFQCIPNGVKDNVVIKTFNQLKNYPNPFSNATTIELSLSKPALVVINIYNSQGALIKSLYNSNLGSGVHIITWDGRNNSGSKVITGLYFYKVTVNNEIYSNKMFLVK
jgi:hypothetical protein